MTKSSAAESRIGPAIENPINATRINVIGTCNILQCARENNIKKVIYSSTSSGYGNNECPNVETQMDDLNNKRIYLNRIYSQEDELNKESSLLNQKINKEKSIISNRYSLIARQRKAVIAGRVLTVLTLFTILYFVLSKLKE